LVVGVPAIRKSNGYVSPTRVPDTYPRKDTYAFLSSSEMDRITFMIDQLTQFYIQNGLQCLSVLAAPQQDMKTKEQR
jgi:hypothetical protein